MKTNKSSWAFAILRRDFKVSTIKASTFSKRPFVGTYGGAGLFEADDGSSAEIDSRNLVFRNNAEGDIISEVTDVAP